MKKKRNRERKSWSSEKSRFREEGRCAQKCRSHSVSRRSSIRTRETASRFNCLQLLRTSAIHNFYSSFLGNFLFSEMLLLLNFQNILSSWSYLWINHWSLGRKFNSIKLMNSYQKWKFWHLLRFRFKEFYFQ